MSRKISYKVVGRYAIPGDKESQTKYYAFAKSTGDVTTNEMADRIQVESTLTKADIIAVLVAFEHVFVDSLSKGEVVRFGDLGSFRIGLSSIGVDVEKNFTVHNIKNAHINFRPGVALRSFLTNLSYTKIGESDNADEVTTNDPQVNPQGV